MAEYIVEIEGSNSLQNIEQAIAGEEATGAEFLRSNISYHEHAITNLVTFNDLPPGQRPQTPLVLVKQGDAPPSGKVSIWAGVMLVSGTNTAVDAYR
jgi:hypothetical protein